MSSDLLQELTAPNGRKYTQPIGLFINNEFVKAKENSTISLDNPATGSHLATVSAAQVEDVDTAVAAAQVAFRTTWRTTLPRQRRNLLNKLADLIDNGFDLGVGGIG